MSLILINIYLLLKIASEKATELGVLYLANSICFKMYTIQLLFIELISGITKSYLKEGN